MSTTYTADEIDEKLAKQMKDITRKIDKVIILASPEDQPDPTETSLYMEVVEEVEKG
jgi:hypothetical protein